MLFIVSYGKSTLTLGVSLASATDLSLGDLVKDLNNRSINTIQIKREREVDKSNKDIIM